MIQQIFPSVNSKIASCAGTKKAVSFTAPQDFSRENGVQRYSLKILWIDPCEENPTAVSDYADRGEPRLLRLDFFPSSL